MTHLQLWTEIATMVNAKNPLELSIVLKLKFIKVSLLVDWYCTLLKSMQRSRTCTFRKFPNFSVVSSKKLMQLLALSASIVDNISYPIQRKMKAYIPPKNAEILYQIIPPVKIAEYVVSNRILKIFLHLLNKNIEEINMK